MNAEQQHLTPLHPSDEFFLGYALADYEAHTGIDQETLAAFLGCPTVCLPRLALHGRPDPASPTFHAELQRLADQFGLNAERLASLLQMLAEADGTGAGTRRYQDVTGAKRR